MKFWISILKKLIKNKDYKCSDKKLQFDLNYIFKNNKGDQILFNNTLYDVINYFNYNNMKIKLTKRNIDNGDIILFFEIDNPSNNEIEILLDEINYLYSDFEYMYSKPQYDNRYGENKLTGPSIYLEGVFGSIVVSKIIYYSIMTKQYNEIDKSIILDVKEEKNEIKVNENSIKFELDNISDKCSFFIMVSKKKLFNTKDSMEKYWEFYFENLKNNSVLNSFFVIPSGTYTKLPYSIEPFSKSAYGYSLHHSSKKELIPFLNEYRDRYFYNLIINAIMQAFLYQKNDEGVFYTPYTSTWLKKDTGITAPYIDTRLNETFNLMIKDFIKFYPQCGIEDNSKNYMDFLIKCQNNEDDIYKKCNGILFPDYFKKNLQRKTHASLNHQLGIANEMYKMFKKTNENKYLECFVKIINFIQETLNEWIKPNGDLYYGIKLGNNNFIYYGDDYVYVTLIDLLHTQINELDRCNFKNQCIDKLIQSKIKYLETQGYCIWDENAKFAPGESTKSRSEALKLYKKLYF